MTTFDLTLAERLKRADWWYESSDDNGVRQRAARDIEEIYRDLYELYKADPDAVRKLWKENGSKEGFAPEWLWR